MSLLLTGTFVASLSGIGMLCGAVDVSPNFTDPQGGQASIDCTIDQEHKNTSGVAVYIESVNCGAVSASTIKSQTKPSGQECLPGAIVADGSSCWTYRQGKLDQTITGFAATPSSGTVGGTSSLSATASSGLPVTFGSATPAVCTVAGNTVSYLAAGTCTVTAD